MSFYLNLFRRCANCYLRNGDIDFLCKSCWSLVSKKNRSLNCKYSINYYFKVRRLIVWNRQSQNLSKNLIYGLKNGHQREVYLKIAKIFLSSYFTDLNKSTIFIPAPGKASFINHAKCLSDSFSILTGFKSIDLLKVTNRQVRQRGLSRKDRFKKQYDLNQEIQIDDYHVIFVDDVITTGATVEAAYTALGRPLNFRVWVLAEKTLEEFN